MQGPQHPIKAAGSQHQGDLLRVPVRFAELEPAENPQPGKRDRQSSTAAR